MNNSEDAAVIPVRKFSNICNSSKQILVRDTETEREKVFDRVSYMMNPDRIAFISKKETMVLDLIKSIVNYKPNDYKVQSINMDTIAIEEYIVSIKN